MLKIYRNITPNQPNGLHYLYKDFDQFLAALGTPYLEIDVANYLINTGTVQIHTNNVAVDVDSITYIIDERGDFKRCYFVDFAEIQSEYINLDIHIDWWATYIHKATITDINVTRCNRNIGIGTYNPIGATKDIEFESLGTSEYINEDDLSIVFSAVFATGASTLFNNNAGTALELFALDLKDVTIPADATDYKTKLKFAIDEIASIFGVEANVGTFDAGVINAYIIETKRCVTSSFGFVPLFKTRPAYAKNAFTFAPSRTVAPFYNKESLKLKLDPNYEYYVGTRYNGLKVIRTTEDVINIDIETIIKQDGLQVTVRQGQNMLDLTDAFSVGLTTNDGNYTTSKRIANALQGIGGVASGIFQIAQRGAGYVTGALSMASAASGMIYEGNAKYQAAGDGLTTFLFGLNVFRYPFWCAKYLSCDDEKADARLFGAEFKQQIDTLESLKNYNYLGTGTAETYVAAVAQVNGVCMNARDDITAQLRNGVYIKIL